MLNACDVPGIGLGFGWKAWDKKRTQANDCLDTFLYWSLSYGKLANYLFDRHSWVGRVWKEQADINSQRPAKSQKQNDECKSW